MTLGRKVDPIAKIVTGNSGNASNGKWTLTGASKNSRDLDKRKDATGPKNRG